MATDEYIKSALKPLFGEAVEHGTYTGKSPAYATFNYISEDGINFADDAPEEDQVDLQVHLFSSKSDTSSLRKETKRLLFQNGFTYPKLVMDQYEDKTRLQHVTYECSLVTEVEL